MTCAEAQDRLPERVAGLLPVEERDALDRHLGSCEECREAQETIELLAASRPTVPEGLEARIRAAVHEAREAGRGAGSLSDADVWRPGPGRRWAFAAAAVLALAVGVPVIVSQDDEGTSGVLALADAENGLWFDDDLMVAGAPALSELSDDALAELLEEMER